MAPNLAARHAGHLASGTVRRVFEPGRHAVHARHAGPQAPPAGGAPRLRHRASCASKRGGGVERPTETRRRGREAPLVGRRTRALVDVGFGWGLVAAAGVSTQHEGGGWKGGRVGVPVGVRGVSSASTERRCHFGPGRDCRAPSPPWSSASRILFFHAVSWQDGRYTQDGVVKQCSAPIILRGFACPHRRLLPPTAAGDRSKPARPAPPPWTAGGSVYKQRLVGRNIFEQRENRRKLEENSSCPDRGRALQSRNISFSRRE